MGQISAGSRPSCLVNSHERVDEAPLDTSNLPDYAARLTDGYAEHPDVARVIAWQRLERGTDPPHAFAVVDITDPDERRKIVRDATARLLAN